MAGENISFEARDPLAGVADLFVTRWSPRAFAPAAIGDAQLARLIDAARWAPSCFNEQPWRFYTSTADTFADYLNLLVEANQAWARSASVLGFLVARTRFARNGKDNAWHAFDCGAAWMSLSLQARTEGLYTHGMAGIKQEAISEYLNLDPEQDQLLMGFAIGKLGDPDLLDASMRDKELPSGRKPLVEIWPGSGQ